MSIRAISVEERRARLVSRHRLSESERTDDVAQIAGDLVGLHSSDPVTVYLSAATRMVKPSIAAVQQALYTDKSLVRVHAMRQTLWVQPVGLAEVAHAATTTRYAKRQETRFLKMLEQWSSVDDAQPWLRQAREQVLSTLEEHRSASTRQLGSLLPELRVPIQIAVGKSYAGTQSALSRLMLQMGFEGLVVRTQQSGSWINSQYRWELMERWLPDGWQEVDPAQAVPELVELWLRSYGPGSVLDIAWWSGLPKGVVQTALATIGAVEVGLDGSPGFVSRTDEEPGLPTERDSVALLPGLDSTTMGWKERSWYLDSDSARVLFDRNGNAGPTIWLNGEVVGGWVQGPSGEVRYQLTVDRGKDALEAIDERCHVLEEFWGDSRFKVRFPAPLQRDLL